MSNEKKIPKPGTSTAVLLIIMLGFIFYSYSFQGQFVWDDAQLIKDNVYISFYDKAIQINPYYAPAHNKLSVLYYSKEEYGLAFKHCIKALELGYRVDPDFVKRLKSINP